MEQIMNSVWKYLQSSQWLIKREILCVLVKVIDSEVCTTDLNFYPALKNGNHIFCIFKYKNVKNGHSLKMYRYILSSSIFPIYTANSSYYVQVSDGSFYLHLFSLLGLQRFLLGIQST